MTTRRAPAASPDEIEAQFYDALQRGDLARLMAVWADDDEALCVQPGGGRTIGLAAIRASFEAMFASGGVPVAPEQVHRVQGPGFAVHHLIERVRAATPPDQPPAERFVVALNVYVARAEGWRLLAHHASPLLVQLPATVGERIGTLH